MGVKLLQRSASHTVRPYPGGHICSVSCRHPDDAVVPNTLTSSTGGAAADAGVPNTALTRSTGAAAAGAGVADAALTRSTGGAVAWRPVPSFAINLDLAPEQRYVGVATRFNSSIWRFYDKLFAHDAALTNALYAMVDKRGPEPDSVMRGEIEGIVATTRLPAKFVQGVQSLYELQTLMVPIVNGSSRQDPLPRRYRALERWPLRGPGCTGRAPPASMHSGGLARSADKGLVVSLQHWQQIT